MKVSSRSVLFVLFAAGAAFAGQKPDPAVASGAADVWSSASFVSPAGVIYYVSPSGDDANGGTTTNNPLKTIQKAIDYGKTSYNSGLNVKVAIAAGVYKESLYLNYNNSQSNVVSVERWGSGDVEIVGYRLQTGWVPYVGNIYKRQWYKNWGWVSNPWSPNCSEIDGTAMLRREFIEYDGIMLVQVFGISDITAGSFYVDETANEIYMYTPDGSAPVASKSFVAEYPASDTSGFHIESTCNVQLKNLQVKYFACALQHGNVRFNDCSNIRVDNVRMLRGAGSGLSLVRNTDVTLYRCFINDNGQLGGSFKQCANLLVDTCYFERNNVRGAWIDFSGWYLGGCKIGDSLQVTVKNSIFRNNKTNGLWFDVGCEEIVVDSVHCENNRLDGGNAAIWVEISSGPTAILNSVLTGSHYGAYVSNSENVLWDGNLIEDNDEYQLAVRGVSDRSPLVGNLWFTSNVVAKTSAGGFLVGSTQSYDSSYYRSALTSGSFSYNDYYHVDSDDQWEDDISSTTDFDGWRASTGLDAVGSNFIGL